MAPQQPATDRTLNTNDGSIGRPVVSLRKGLDAAVKPGPTPPSTCTTSCRAVCSSDTRTLGSCACATLMSSGTLWTQRRHGEGARYRRSREAPRAGRKSYAPVEPTDCAAVVLVTLKARGETGYSKT